MFIVWQRFIQNTQNKILIYLTYLAHEYFADFFNFLKMWNRLLQFYDTAYMKDVSNCTPAFESIS